MLSDNNEKSPFITEQELALRWRVSTRTIQTWRAEGKTPEPYKYGYKSVRYKLSDVIELEENRRISQEVEVL